MIIPCLSEHLYFVGNAFVFSAILINNLFPQILSVYLLSIKIHLAMGIGAGIFFTNSFFLSKVRPPSIGLRPLTRTHFVQAKSPMRKPRFRLKLVGCAVMSNGIADIRLS